MEKISSLVCRVFFGVAFLLFGLAVFEKLANFTGYTVIGDYYRPGRLLEFTIILLVFIVAILLREIREELKSRA